jgi:hypothetical protein
MVYGVCPPSTPLSTLLTTPLSDWNQTFINFDVGPQHAQVRVHDDFLDINDLASEVFKKIFKYAELVPIPSDSDRRAYRIPESVDMFRSWLEFLARGTPQPDGGPELCVLDQEKAGELERFARKWDMEGLQTELRGFLTEEMGGMLH